MHRLSTLRLLVSAVGLLAIIAPVACGGDDGTEAESASAAGSGGSAGRAGAGGGLAGHGGSAGHVAGGSSGSGGSTAAGHGGAGGSVAAGHAGSSAAGHPGGAAGAIAGGTGGAPPAGAGVGGESPGGSAGANDAGGSAGTSAGAAGDDQGGSAGADQGGSADQAGSAGTGGSPDVSCSGVADNTVDPTTPGSVCCGGLAVPGMCCDGAAGDALCNGATAGTVCQANACLACDAHAGGVGVFVDPDLGSDVPGNGSGTAGGVLHASCSFASITYALHYGFTVHVAAGSVASAKEIFPIELDRTVIGDGAGATVRVPPTKLGLSAFHVGSDAQGGEQGGTLRNLTLDGSHSGTPASSLSGLVVDGRGTAVVSDLTVIGFGQDGILVGNPKGPIAQGGNAEGLTFGGLTAQGGLTVTGNGLVGNAYSGIHVQAAGQADLEAVTAGVVSNNGLAGIFVEQAGFIHVAGDVATRTFVVGENQLNGIVTDITDFTEPGNVAKPITPPPSIFSGVVVENTVLGDGFSVQAADRLQIIDSTSLGNGGSGIVIGGDVTKGTFDIATGNVFQHTIAQGQPNQGAGVCLGDPGAPPSIDISKDTFASAVDCGSVGGSLTEMLGCTGQVDLGWNSPGKPKLTAGACTY